MDPLDYPQTSRRAGIIAVPLLTVAGLCLVAHDHDLKTNYVQVPARVEAIETHCWINRTLVLFPYSTDIDCAEAPHIHVHRHESLNYDSTLTYRFVSPIDRKMRMVTIHHLGAAASALPKPGELVTVFAHKTRPDVFEYGGLYPNTFIRDQAL